MTVVNGFNIFSRLAIALLLLLFATARYVADPGRGRRGGGILVQGKEGRGSEYRDVEKRDNIA